MTLRFDTGQEDLQDPHFTAIDGVTPPANAYERAIKALQQVATDRAVLLEQRAAGRQAAAAADAKVWAAIFQSDAAIAAAQERISVAGKMPEPDASPGVLTLHDLAAQCAAGHD
jgi:beta-phosphoglucomutase-like phosphatase (HAD superfamily)